MELHEFEDLNTLNAAAEAEEAELEELLLNTAEAETIKGGTGGDGYGGSFRLNHNEMTAEDDEEAELEDLPASDDAEAEVKGGSGTIYVGSASGGVWKVI